MADLSEYRELDGIEFSPEVRKLMSLFAECWEECHADDCETCKYRHGKNYYKVMYCLSERYADKLISKLLCELLLPEESRMINLAKHTIGYGHRKPYKRNGRMFYRPYRNYYAAAGDVLRIWECMVNLGYAYRLEASEKLPIYAMTRVGMDWLGEKLGCTIYDEEK